MASDTPAPVDHAALAEKLEYDLQRAIVMASVAYNRLDRAISEEVARTARSEIRVVRKIIEEVQSALRAAGIGAGVVPHDVVRLVLAARAVAFDVPTLEAPDASYLQDWQKRIKELDAASEAFADRVPWDDEPEGT